MFKYEEREPDHEDIELPDNNNIELAIQRSLELSAQDAENRKQELEESEVINTYIFEYLDRYYTVEQVYIIKNYYILKGRIINYEQLSKITGYNISKISGIIREFKKDVRHNLPFYIRNGMKKEEYIEIMKEICNKINL
jgi:DNA-binding Lrp family transcriptional regulator